MNKLIPCLCLLALGLMHCADPKEEEENNTPNPTIDMPGDSGHAHDMSDISDMSADMKDMGKDMAPETIEIPPGPWDISKKGPYNVGYDVTEITYMERPSMKPRTLEVVVWYPTVIKSARRARYAKVLTRPEVYNKVPIAPDKKFPLLLFSHGNASLAEQSYFMTEYFASHGWIIIAPYHTGNSVRDTEGSVNYRSALFRPQDMSAVLDWTEKMPEDFVLHDKLTDQVAMSGHSFGGYTTLASAGGGFIIDEITQVCAENPPNQKLCDAFKEENELAVFRQGFADARIKVAISQTPAGAFFFGDKLSQIKIPTMIMTGARDKSLLNSEEGDPIWAAMPAAGHNIRLDFKNAGHFTFSNACDLFPTLEQVSSDGCDETFIPQDEAFPMINQYALAFAQRWALGDMRHEALLSGQTQPWMSAIDFEKK